MVNGMVTYPASRTEIVEVARYIEAQNSINLGNANMRERVSETPSVKMGDLLHIQSGTEKSNTALRRPLAGPTKSRCILWLMVQSTAIVSGNVLDASCE